MSILLTGLFTKSADSNYSDSRSDQKYHHPKVKLGIDFLLQACTLRSVGLGGLDDVVRWDVLESGQAAERRCFHWDSATQGPKVRIGQNLAKKMSHLFLLEQIIWFLILLSFHGWVLGTASFSCDRWWRRWFSSRLGSTGYRIQDCTKQILAAIALSSWGSPSHADHDCDDFDDDHLDVIRSRSRSHLTTSRWD